MLTKCLLWVGISSCWGGGGRVNEERGLWPQGDRRGQEGLLTQVSPPMHLPLHALFILSYLHSLFIHSFIQKAFLELG